MPTTVFRNRTDAGEVLARHLTAYAGRKNLIVLGLPRGGVPVACMVARALGARLDILLVRKLGVPGHEEYAMGAIASGGARVLQQDIISRLRIPMAAVEAATQREQAELERRERLYRGERPEPRLADAVVMLVDDGLATGSTMKVAIQAVRQSNPSRIVVAVPVGAQEACEALQTDVDDLICPMRPVPFFSVGQWYQDFQQTTDDEVRTLLTQAEKSHSQTHPHLPGSNPADPD